DRPGRVRRRLLALGDALHVAPPLEDHAAIDLERRGGDVALDLAGGLDLDRLLGADVPDDGALDDDLADVDLGFDLGAFTHDEHVVGEDLSGELSLDPDRPLEGQLALARRARTA